MKYFLPTVLAALLFSTGCKKKSSDETPATYMPNTANNSWSYNTKTNAPTASTGSYVLKATNKDTLIGSRTYRVYTNTGGQNEYYAQSGTNYYQFASAATTGLSTQSVETLYLKDASVGSSWSESQTLTMSGVTATVPVNYQVIEKDISYTVNGKTYNNVTHVKATLGSISIPGFPLPLTPTSDVNFYYSRGIGRIYSHVKIALSVALISLNINIDEELLLNNYTIQ
jgi:hypothetical protein